MAENAEARMTPMNTVRTTVAARPTWGSARENGATPRIETQMTYFRPKRSPRGPPRMVPAATDTRKTNRRSCEPWIERLNRWMQGQVGARARIHHLGRAQHAESLGIETLVGGVLRRRHRSRDVRVSDARSTSRRGPDESRIGIQVTDLIVDAGAVVRARMVIEIALVGTAEAEQVISLEHGQVVANALVLT